MSNNPINQSISNLARQFRSGELRAVELVEVISERHESSNESFGAYRRWLPGEARKLAAAADQAFKAGKDLGPLQGIPVSIKDLYGWQVTDTQAGSPLSLPPEWSTNGPVVSRLIEQCAAITGKTHTVEFAFGGLGINHHLGTPQNPWDANNHRVPGGSSAGAGVSLSSASALVALGTDTAGSVRIPASVTGNVGLKTTAGRWSLQGIVPLSPTLDTPGPLTRTVEDAIWAFAAIDPHTKDHETCIRNAEDFDLSSLRIAMADDTLWQDLDAGIEDAVNTALKEIVDAGASQSSLAMPEVAEATSVHRKGSVLSAELDEFLMNELPDCRERLHPIIASRVHDGGDISAREFLGRKRQLKRIAQAANSHFERIDVIVSPTVALTPPTLAEVEEIEVYRARNFKSLRNTNTASSLGLCALTIPVGLDACAMPVGLQLMAKANDETRLLAIGRACERKLGTAIERLGIAPMRA